MRTATKKKKPCKHDPDPESYDCVDSWDGGCSIGIECRHCGEFGYASVLDEDFEWQDEV
jgi:hypothetical protein